MAKPDRRNLKGPVKLSRLIAQVVSDLAGDLEEEVVSRSLTLLETAPLQEACDYLKQKLDDAETFANIEISQYAALRQVVGCFVKNADAPGSTALLRKKTAFASFDASEKKCRLTNKRLAFYADHPSRRSDTVGEIFDRARDIIHNIVGPLGRLQLQEIIEGSGFGPGFTFLNEEKDQKHLYFKCYGPHSVTKDALPYMKLWLNHSENWKQSLIEHDCTYSVVEGNRLTTVPKDSSKDRTIAIEPSFNVYMQKGVDQFLKRRLLRHGVTLHNQERNHEPAREGSLKPLHAATVDLSSASDCVSIEAVRTLFPYDWFILLDDLRSKSYTLDKGKTWSQYEKFSSMGNAFTFPVESILFYAVAKACTVYAGGNQEVLRVYGDDIIIDPRAYCLLIEVLKFLGFSPNISKSFAFGPFRETCGADFLRGIDVRPGYIKQVPKNDQEVYNLFNRLLWNRFGFRTQRTLAFLYDCVRKPLIGPPHLPAGSKYWRWIAGKSVHHDHYFHAPKSSGERFARTDPDWQCIVYEFDELRFKPKKVDSSSYVGQFLYLAFLLGVRKGDVDSYSRFRRILVRKTTSYWPDPPWRPYLYDL